MKSFILCASIFLMAAANASPYDLGSSRAHGSDDQVGHQIKEQFGEDEAKNLTNKYSEIDMYDVDVDAIDIEDRWIDIWLDGKTMNGSEPNWMDLLYFMARNIAI